MSSILDLERIDAMRESVFATVHQDVRKRGRTLRHRLAGGAAVVVVAGVGIGMIPHLAGTGSAGDEVQSQVGTADSLTSLPEAAPAMAPDTATNPGVAGGASSGFAGAGIADTAKAADGDAQIITNAYVEAKVDDPSQAADHISVWTEGHGGTVSDRNEGSNGMDGADPYASITIHVPSATDAITEIRSMGDVTTVSMTQSDVTTQYRDLAAQINELQVSVTRLQNLMAGAKTTDELLQAEQALTDRQAQLDSLRSQKAYLDDQVTLETLTVNFTSTTKAATPESKGFWHGLVDGWNALADSVTGLFVALGWVLPWLGVLVVLGLVIWGVRKLRRRG